MIDNYYSLSYLCDPMERTINIQLLRDWTAKNGLALLQHKSMCSHSLLDLLVRGKYKGRLRPSTQRLISEATGLPVDTLFPLVDCAQSAQSAN